MLLQLVFFTQSIDEGNGRTISSRNANNPSINLCFSTELAASGARQTLRWIERLKEKWKRKNKQKPGRLENTSKIPLVCSKFDSKRMFSARLRTQKPITVSKWPKSQQFQQFYKLVRLETTILATQQKIPLLNGFQSGKKRRQVDVDSRLTRYNQSLTFNFTLGFLNHRVANRSLAFIHLARSLASGTERRRRRI